MYIGSLDPVSNRAGWTFVREIVDDDTDEPIDLSDCEIVFEVRRCTDGRALLSATSANGGVTILDTGIFQATFTRAEMASLSAGSYEVGCTVQRDDEETQQFIIGKLPVLDGIVSR